MVAPLLLVAVLVASYSTLAPPAARVVIASGQGTIDYKGIRVNNYVYEPQALSVKTGTTVTWVNEDSGTIHTVAGESSFFGSGNIRLGESFSFTFGDAGTYEYSCRVHPWMVGTVMVSS